MTQTSKCDTCRQRKVKCDEETPQCGACRKKDRLCTYSYGRVSAIVVQDPNQFTKHGKSKLEPVIYALSSSSDQSGPPSGSAASDLRITTERKAEKGQGCFRTLVPAHKPGSQISKKKIVHQRRTLEQYLRLLHKGSTIGSVRPLSPETTLIARYIDMLGPHTLQKQPLSILGTWVQSIPARIGSNQMLDLAAEFFVDSFAVFWDDSYSKRKTARASKAKALREMQLAVLNSQDGPTYEILLATKMHYAAEALMGMDTMYHAIHAFGLAELLKSGAVANVDDEHFWNLIDNTYIDDVNEAMLTDRNSIYDNEFYLSITYPSPLESDDISLSASQRASMAIMHIFIQCPRLCRLVRRAISDPADASVLASAVSLVESLWEFSLSEQVSALLKVSITTTPHSSFLDITDIMPESFKYDSIQNMILCTRYWMLQNVLCGLADTLYWYFPVQVGLSLLPSADTLRTIDTHAALQLTRSISWAESVSNKLPLVSLRLNTPLQVSIGPWHRIIRRGKAAQAISQRVDENADPNLLSSMLLAHRMKAWIINYCNRIHQQWGVYTLEEQPLLEVLDIMAGEKIPDWLPIRVSFAAEDGEMVLKLEYENKTGSYQQQIDLEKKTQNPMPNPLEPGQQWQRENLRVQQLPFRSANKYDYFTSSMADKTEAADRVISSNPNWSNTVRPEDYLYATGRNLCATSGSWPVTPHISISLPESTHVAPEFTNMLQNRALLEPEQQNEDSERLTDLASSLGP